MTILSKVLAGSLIGLAGITCAQASVLYNWQPLSDGGPSAGFPQGGPLSTTGGSLVFTDSAYSSGHVITSESLDYSSEPASARRADSPIESVQLSVQYTGGLGFNEFNVFANPTQPQFSDGETVNPPLYFLESDISIIDDMLAGSLDLLTDSDEFHMTADNSGLWTINDFGSDEILAERGSGATGRWVLDASSLPTGSVSVPAPNAWSLFLLSALGMLGLAWHRKRSA